MLLCRKSWKNRKGERGLFKDNLIFLRREAGLSQEELAFRLGVSRQTVSKYETGESLPDVGTAQRIAREFGVGLDELVSYEPAENGGLRLPPRGKHMFGSVTVGDKGQIVIPARARRIFGIAPGDNLILLGDEERGLALIKEKDMLEMLGAANAPDGKR